MVQTKGENPVKFTLKQRLVILSEKMIQFIFILFFRVALKTNLDWATKTLRDWSNYPVRYGWYVFGNWRYSVSGKLQPLVAKLNSQKLCVYCQWVLWNDEPHEECDRQLFPKLDILDGIQDLDYVDDLARSDDMDPSEKEGPDYEDESIENNQWEEEDDLREEEDDNFPQPQTEIRIFHKKECKECGKIFNTSNGSGLCFECTLKDHCNGNPPEEGDFNTAGILSGTISNKAWGELRDYV